MYVARDDSVVMQNGFVLKEIRKSQCYSCGSGQWVDSTTKINAILMITACVLYYFSISSVVIRTSHDTVHTSGCQTHIVSVMMKLVKLYKRV